MPEAAKRAALLVIPARAMRDGPVIYLILLSILVAGVSLAATWGLHRAKVLDVPNARSSHDRPVPRIGGVAIVVSFFIGFAIIAFGAAETGLRGFQVAVLAASAAGIATMGLLDDVRRVRSVAWKFGAQLGAAILVVGAGISFQAFTLPLGGTYELGLLGAVLTVLWLVGITNATNFMDGLDGLVAGTCILAAIFLAIVASIAGDRFVSLACILVASAACGFFVFNFPKASIFMGDVGSQFLGFALGSFAVVAALHEPSQALLLAMPLLLFHFIFDTVFTFFRRLVSGMNVSQAHRTHLYQLLNQLGCSHAAVSGLHFGLTALQGLAALMLFRLAPEHQLVVFVPFLAFEITYAIVVMRLAEQKGLLPPSGAR